ncbi:MAG: penicillin-binding transpeptidase domain-containing protein [Lachnospiraceae bacterium]|nr:penicillin-binding transpeptidase domain-containing protein [Lachnospiraceae bacterium]
MKQKKNRNSYILGMVYLFILLFAGLAVYLCYFTWKEAPQLVNSPYNGRLEKLNETCIRGDIVSADGQVLAASKVDDKGNEERSYLYGAVFSHVVGYTSVGEAGLESFANYYLLNSHESAWNKLYKELTDRKADGDTVVTTLDTKLQKIVYDAMEGYEGACVVMEPSTGKILAMVSKPDFDPNTLEEDYADLVSDSSNSNLVNRVTQGLYSPGSIFKIVTALAYIEQNPDDWEDYTYNCQGAITVDGKTVRCAHGNAHGKVDLKRAFALSCNGAFINMGLSLDADLYRQTAERLQFNQKLTTKFPVAASKFDLNSDSSQWSVMQTSFGQGNTLVTPLQNAMIVSAVANKGIMMNPMLLDEVKSTDGTQVETFAPESLGSVMTAKQASIMEEMMTEVVNNGTAKILQSENYQAAAKTGSAQTDNEKETNAWLTAYAPVKNPQLVVSIVLEEAGAGSEAGGPIVKKIFDAYLEK